ncbi:hypothetical protein PAXRUDRAFT_141720 [Paxillus rubicundulus Ve08.2h10]|uniref:Uncharacterized protein n=1 Tax=Paxillus rubicundulus Ve08.2h10 TaxID=930991 RepID=A0A0D0E2S5_9AGAM|nr:hypothetical protein PAXRUDRAFT_141720 [Paxillus rubicundulus Ve08.2h10]
MAGHAIDYSRSTRSVCKGPEPCAGTPLPPGSLRYGQIYKGEFGETVRWRHWGCVTPDILRDLAITDLDIITGFSTIRPDDQQKVRRAIATQRVDPADIPTSAKLVAAPVTTVAEPHAPSQPRQPSSQALGQKKRKLASESSGTSSQPSVPRASTALVGARPLTSSALHDEDDEVMIIEPEPVDELYCVTRASIVGVQYYQGLVGPGEEVRLIREPHNQYDRNAIQVKNIGGTQVGHIPRNIASKLAPLLDQRLITVEGVMYEGNLTGFSYSLSMSLKIYGASDKRDILEPLLIWATPRKKGFPPRGRGGVPGEASSSAATMPGPSQPRGRTSAQTQAQQEAIRKQQEALQQAAELKQMLAGLEKVDDEGRRASLLDTLCSTVDILNLPVHPNPPGVASGELLVNLLKHQSQALQWCLDREYPELPIKESDKPVEFWQYRKAGTKPYYFNLATKTPQEITSPPILGRGALVGDSMGLGKTLTMIALILATKQDVPAHYSNSTLIVVPLSVMSNWEKQIEEHCVRGALSACVYYGSTRNMAPQQLMQYDVVITTYQTVAGETDPRNAVRDDDEDGPAKKKKKSSKGLFDVKWKRIILDEGHNIRNPKTKMAKAVCKLPAERRWVLSGTPIDLGSVLTFLQICRPLDNEDFFKRLVLRPLKDGDPAGAELLRALMSHICIRRTKEVMRCPRLIMRRRCKITRATPSSPSPQQVPQSTVDITLIPVTLSDEARALYDAVEAISQQRVERILNQAGGMNANVTSNVLSMLTRLRQLALHPGLVPSDYLDKLRENEDLEATASSAIHITPQLRAKLQGLLLKAIEDNEECPICLFVLTEPRITACAHPFCLACITEVIARDPKCPMDRRVIGMSDLVEPPPPTELTQAPVKQDEDNDQSELRTGSSAKIDQLIHLLKLIPSDSKSLVFSQFTSFLDKIGEALEEHGIPYVRFDGQLSARRRQEVLERFSIPLESNAPLSTCEETSVPSARRRRTTTPSTLVDDENSFGNGNDSDFKDDFSSQVKKTNGKAKKAKGKGKARAKPVSARAMFDSSAFDGEVPRVMLISLKAGALGLNLTAANNVFMWWQEGIESQAIDRCNRIGQRKPVHVYQLIAENTVESKARPFPVIEIQDKKKQLIQHVCSCCPLIG